MFFSCDQCLAAVENPSPWREILVVSQSKNVQFSKFVLHMYVFLCNILPVCALSFSVYEQKRWTQRKW